MTVYRDNYPHNIEAPQRVYIEYSQDIEFDYSTGKIPLGESYEGFVWESVYNPIPHSGKEGFTLGPHMWMRIRIGEKEAWTKPIKFKEPYSNITTTSSEIDVTTGLVKFRLVFSLDDGTTIYSDYITVTNGSDGRGVINSQIINSNLIISYSDGTTQNVGRVVGYDGFGFPSVGSTIEGNMAIVDSNNNVIWQQFITSLNNVVTTVNPIQYANGEFSHLNTDGYRHIPVGGNNTNVLSTDGNGVYTWRDLDDSNTGYIPWTAIDDTAGLGDTNKIYSADYITNLIAGLSAFGIKYSVNLYNNLAGIVGPSEGELAVVTSDPLYPNRPVYKYTGGSWVSFFELDASHNHDDRYYTKTQLNSPGAGGQVHWNNLIGVPVFSSSFIVAGDIGSTTIYTDDTVSIFGLNGINIEVDEPTKNVYIHGYTNGVGLDLTGNNFSHSDTSSVSNTNNLNGSVIQNLTFDDFGHVISILSVNLDSRYSLTSHVHQNLTPGNGLSGSAYNGGTARTWNLSYGGTGGIYGVSNSVARFDHSHSTLPTISETTFTIGTGSSTAKKMTFSSGSDLVTIELSGYFSSGFAVSSGAVLGVIPSGYRPTLQGSYWIFWQGTGGDLRSAEIWVYPDGTIKFGRSGDLGGAMRLFTGYLTFLIK